MAAMKSTASNTSKPFDRLRAPSKVEGFLCFLTFILDRYNTVSPVVFTRILSSEKGFRMMYWASLSISGFFPGGMARLR